MGNRTALACVGLSLGVVFGCGDDDATTSDTTGAGNSGAIGSGGAGDGGDGQGGQGAAGGNATGGAGGGAGGSSNPGHVWSQRFGDRVVDKLTRLGVSGDGDVVFTGRFAGDIDFGGTMLTASAGQNVFVASLDAGGAVSWAKGLGDLFVWDLDFDSAGNVLLAGQSIAPNDLGGGPLPVKADAFIVKYAPDGSHVMTKPFVNLLPVSFVYPSYLSIDGDDDILLGGTFSGTVDFGDGPKTADGFDCWIAKLDSAGTLLWSRTFGGTNAESIRDITTDDAGGVIAIGEFLGTLSAGGAVHTAAATPSLFIVKYDANGALVQSQGYATDVRTEMSVVADGTDFVVAGGFQGSLELVAGSPMTSMGGHDVFVARYDGSGAIVVADRYGSSLTDYGAHLARDPSGDVWLTGQIGASVDFGGGAVGTDGNGMFLAAFDQSLAHVYSAGFGDMEEQAGVSLGADPDGAMVVGATGEGTMSFGGGDLTSAGMSDVFVAKLD